MMEYKGYQASYKFDEEEGTFIGDVVNISDIIFFYGDTVEQLNEEFRFSIDDSWLRARKRAGSLTSRLPKASVLSCLRPSITRPQPQQKPTVRTSMRGLRRRLRTP